MAILLSVLTSDWAANGHLVHRKKVKKGKASSLDIAPLTILNSGTFTTSEVATDRQ